MYHATYNCTYCSLHFHGLHNSSENLNYPGCSHCNVNVMAFNSAPKMDEGGGG